MGVVHLKLKVPGPDGDVVAPGELEFEPSTRLAVDDYVLLPERFTVRVETGDETVTLAETGIDWCWHVIERFDGGTERWVIVGPDPADYRDLVDVDPSTLEPAAAPEAAWWAVAQQAIDDSAQAQAAAQAAAVDATIAATASSEASTSASAAEAAAAQAATALLDSAEFIGSELAREGSPAQVEVSTQIDEAVSALYSIDFDTDGIPYLTEWAGQPGSQIAFDTDGVPYLTIGA